MKIHYPVILLTLIIAVGCGLDGGVSSLNETAPNGTVIYQASFTGTNGVSGSVQIYSVSGSAVVRFAGLTTPTDTKYFFFLEKSVAPTVAYTAQLKAPLGSQNYYTGLTVGPIWTRVVFRGNSDTSAAEIASTTLTATTP